MWSISSEGRVDSTSVERRLRYLLEILEPAGRHLLEVVLEQSLRADFYCYWVSATGQGGPEITAETLGRMSDLGATLGFEFHGPFGED